MSTAIFRAEPQLHTHYAESEKLGDQITELCSYLYAAFENLFNSIVGRLDNRRDGCRDPGGRCNERNRLGLAGSHTRRGIGIRPGL